MAIKDTRILCDRNGYILLIDTLLGDLLFLSQLYKLNNDR